MNAKIVKLDFVTQDLVTVYVDVFNAGTVETHELDFDPETLTLADFPMQVISRALEHKLYSEKVLSDICNETFEVNEFYLTHTKAYAV